MSRLWPVVKSFGNSYNNMSILSYVMQNLYVLLSNLPPMRINSWSVRKLVHSSVRWTDRSRMYTDLNLPMSIKNGYNIMS